MSSRAEAAVESDFRGELSMTIGLRVSRLAGELGVMCEGDITVSTKPLSMQIDRHAGEQDGVIK